MKDDRVERPIKKKEYEIRLTSVKARRGWMSLQATMRNSLADSWDFLTRTPLLETSTNYRLRGQLSTVTRGGTSRDRWQHKRTSQGDARIWFWVENGVVFIEEVHTHHPNQTK